MTSILWLRQDLRLSDQAAYAAAAAEGAVVPVYVLDDDAADAWAIGGAQRWWLHHSLDAIANAFADKGLTLILRRGDAVTELVEVARAAGAERIHALRHYEPWWQKAEAALAERIDLQLHDGVLLTPPEAVRTGSGGRYRMFTPFWRALSAAMPPPAPHRAPTKVVGHDGDITSDTLADWDLLPDNPDWASAFGNDWTPGEAGAHAALDAFVPEIGAYDQARNLPSIEGSSRLSPHLHFGEVSPAAVWHGVSRAAGAAAQPYLRELGWRDFAANLIDQLPDYGRHNGRDAFDVFPWRSGASADRDFRAWSRGRTGYPIVDAGMRQLWTTGWMHNRVRMIAASFLIKHLLIDWKRGERWFWDTLIDADYGNNSVNWQWVAGTGIDSNMFVRIMAPLTQSEKFDAAGYIREWVPELTDLPDADIHDPHGNGRAPATYAKPLIGHREARDRALGAYRHIKN